MCQESIVELLGLWSIRVYLSLSVSKIPMIMDVKENSVKLSFRSIFSVATILAKSDQLVRARPCPLLLN
jgi:hypothetical protein